MQSVVDRFARQEKALAKERAAKEAAQQDVDFKALHRQASNGHNVVSVSLPCPEKGEGKDILEADIIVLREGERYFRYM